MNRLWAAFKSHPYICNVLGYTTLFASADLIQQNLLDQNPPPGSTSGSTSGSSSGSTSGSSSGGRGGLVDWTQTARVATVGFCFHANFNYRWLRGLETLLPGGGLKMVAGKVVLDQLVAAPLTISAFYIGLSFLENKADLLEDWRHKFWTSYQTGVVYWSTMQAINFTFVPPVARTVFLGGVALTFTVFLCHLRQQQNHQRE